MDEVENKIDSVPENGTESIHNKIENMNKSSKKEENKKVGNSLVQLEDIDSTYEIDDDMIADINSSLALQVSSVLDDKEKVRMLRLKKIHRRKKALVISLSSLVTLVLICCFFIFTKTGQRLLVNAVADSTYHRIFTEEPLQNTENDVVNLEDTYNKKHIAQLSTEEDDNIVHILLIGIEEIQNAQNTDTMIVASVNKETGEISLLSLMRDLYVQIPGYANNRLNAAYSLGGISKLYDTIELNFGIKLDGYVLVNFSTFEYIVDQIGGVQVTLNEKEAYYLNHTNYISDVSQRHVSVGTQMLTGNQTVGYCRVRKVGTGTEANDFGRTQRQRAVLNYIFDKLKSKNAIELLGFMNDVLNNVQLKTDLTKAEYKEYLSLFLDLKLYQSELVNYRIPSDGTFSNQSVLIGQLKQSVLVPDNWAAVREEIRGYYGE